MGRALALKLWCPYCGAPPGKNCVGYKGKERKSVHQERIEKLDPNGTFVRKGAPRAHTRY